MRKTHQKNTVRYYLLILTFLLFLFVSGDFGLVDVQRTAIVMAVGIDREDDTFILTSQIAIPQSAKQGKSTETVQLVSRGETVAQAFEEINAKTGWYPKLVFCHLIILGEKTAQNNVFDALDFFLLDEYLSDNCLIATCQGLAADLLNVTALVDPSGSLAMQKVLSSHSERVGTVLTSTLREFSIGYFSDSKSAFLPVLSTQPQQEKIGQKPSGNSSNSSSNEGSSNNGKSENNSQDKPVFTAGETALFVGGKRVGALSKEDTFAFNAVKNKLRLATYTVENDGGRYSFTIRRNSPKVKFSLDQDGKMKVKIHLTMTAGLLDCSKSLSLEEGKDAGDIPKSAFENAEVLLSSQITALFEKCRSVNCDLFEVRSALQKQEKKRYEKLKDNILQNAEVEVSVRFQGVR
jgi:Ger(x)C family germination protein